MTHNSQRGRRSGRGVGWLPGESVFDSWEGQSCVRTTLGFIQLPTKWLWCEATTDLHLVLRLRGRAAAPLLLPPSISPGPLWPSCTDCFWQGTQPEHCKVKVKLALGQATKTQSRCRGITTLSLTSVPDGGGWLTARPGRFDRGKETRYSLYWRPCGSQGRCGRVRKISLLPGFDPRTVQLVANCYTDWAIAAHL